jgi:hypothetical protein
MGLLAFGSSGSYSLTDGITMTEYQAQHASMQSLLGQQNISKGLMGGLQNSLANAAASNQMAQYYGNLSTSTDSAIVSFSDYTKMLRNEPMDDPVDMLTPAKRKLRKKYSDATPLKGFLDRLRFEIDSWHGDALDQFAFA